jgi:hypothetical protein
MTQEQLIYIIASICIYAQSHSSDEDAWDRQNLHDKMEHVSYVVACFLAQNTKLGNNGVEFDVVLNDLCGPVLTEQEWHDKTKILVQEYNQWDTQDDFTSVQ